MSGKKSRKRVRKSGNKQRRGLESRVRRKMKEHFPEGKVVNRESPDGVKMSEVLEEFVAPYREYAESKEAYRKLLSIAVVGWNAALFPEKERREQLDKALTALPDDAKPDAEEIVQELIHRKEEHFSSYKRLIIEFDIADSGDEWHLSVISTMPPE